MSINNIYLVAGFVLWLYLLCCLSLKLILDRHSKGRKKRKLRLINKFLSPDKNDNFRKRNFKKLCRAVREPETLEYFCQGLREISRNGAELPGSPGEFYSAELFETLFKENAENPLDRCYLLTELSGLNICSPEIAGIIENCSRSSELERCWAERLRAESPAERSEVSRV